MERERRWPCRWRRSRRSAGRCGKILICFFLFLVQKEKTLGFFSSSFVSLSVCSSSSFSSSSHHAIIPPPSKKVRSSFSSFYLNTIPQLLLPHLKTYETPKKSITLSNVTTKKTELNPRLSSPLSSCFFCFYVSVCVNKKKNNIKAKKKRGKSHEEEEETRTRGGGATMRVSHLFFGAVSFLSLVAAFPPSLSLSLPPPRTLEGKNVSFF